MRQLHRSLTERRLANQHPTVLIAYGAGHYLRSAGATGIDQHHQRNLFCQFTALRPVNLVNILRPATLAEDNALRQEEVRHSNRLIQEPTRIVTKVEDKALGILRQQLLQCLRKLFLGVSAKTRQAYVRNALFQHLGLDDRNLDEGPGDRYVKRVDTLAPDRQRHVRAFWPPDQGDHLVQRPIRHRFAINAYHYVTGLKAGQIRRLPIHWAHDLCQPFVIFPHECANTLKRTFHPLADQLGCFRRRKACILVVQRIQ